MIHKGFLKPEISIRKIGKRQFWIGVVIGLFSAVILSFFLNYSREALRMITFMREPLILTEKEFRIYDLFFAAFSTSIGFGFTIIYWLQGGNIKIRRGYLRTYTTSNAWFISMIALMVVARFGSVLVILVYSSYTYDGQLDIIKDFWIILLLVPVYVFFVHWNSIRLIFKTRYWVLISVLVYILATFTIFMTITADRDILNQCHYSMNEERFDFIDSEFEQAKKHGIYFSSTTREVLRKRYDNRIYDLVGNLKQAFRSGAKVSMDSLLLEKIVIHNMNEHSYFYYVNSGNRDTNWPYALPEDVYRQIKMHEIDSKETKVLFQILSEQISLFNAHLLDGSEDAEYTTYEKELSFFKRTLMNRTETIQSRLIQVVDKLKSDEGYKRYHHLLDDIEFDDYGGSQKYCIIDL
jgi:hypothetical protein